MIEAIAYCWSVIWDLFVDLVFYAISKVCLGFTSQKNDTVRLDGHDFFNQEFRTFANVRFFLYLRHIIPFFNRLWNLYKICYPTLPLPRLMLTKWRDETTVKQSIPQYHRVSVSHIPRDSPSHFFRNFFFV